MTSFETKIIAMIRSNRFQTLSKLFMYANKTAYVNLHLYREYKTYSMTNPAFKELAHDALIDTAYYTEKAIKSLVAMREDAKKILPRLRNATIDSMRLQNQILDAAKYYVQIEKDWESLLNIVAEIENNEEVSAEWEDFIRKDLTTLFSDIIRLSDKAIAILVNVQNQLQKEAGI